MFVIGASIGFYGHTTSQGFHLGLGLPLVFSIGSYICYRASICFMFVTGTHQDIYHLVFWSFNMFHFVAVVHH